ncbi:MAG: methylenetetrahydrofolate reductase [bacterium]|nr:methylenetetrahydrofolate reductase [bacterium]
MDKNDKVIFEVICPPLNWQYAKKMEFIQRISKIMIKNNIVYLNLPEIVDENRNGDRTFKFSPKMKNYIFAREVVSYAKTEFNYNIEPIINIVVPLIPKEKFLDHFDEIYGMGYRNFIFVGKDRSDIEYPGYEVTDATYIIKSKYSDVRVGGIVIFHRDNELKRLIKKMGVGMDFFVSQIIYETVDLKSFLSSVFDVDISIYVSVAPICSYKELDFLRWLGVNLEQVKFVENDIKTQSLNYIKKVVIDLLEINLLNIYKRKGTFLGVNVEHITYSNLEVVDSIIGMISLKMENLKLLNRSPLFRSGGV